MTHPISLGDAAEIIRGVSFNKSEVRTVETEGYLPILRAGNIQERLLTDRDLIWVPSTRVSPHQRLRIGDIVLAVSSGSSALVGKTAILEEEWTGSVGAFCALLRPRKNVFPQYLAQWFRSPTFTSWRTSKTRGSNIQNLQITALSEIDILLPSFVEQKQLAHVLSDQIDATRIARSASAEQIALSERIAVAGLRALFLGTVPISAVASMSRKPDGWTWHHLLALARLESGHTPSRRHPEWWGGDVPWLALPDIRKLHGKRAYETAERTNDAGLANSSARLLPAGTVCLSRTASVGFVTILGKPMATSQDFANWICDPNKLDPEFLMYAFMASQDYLRELGSGAVHKTIYMPTIESFQVCAPDIGEQRRIAHTLRERLVAADALTEHLKSRLVEIERLPQRLLAAAFGQPG